MTDSKKNTPDNGISEMVKFFLKDSTSLRNEINHISDLNEIVHPLTFSRDSKKQPDVHLIPVMDKTDSSIKKLFLETFK